MARIEQRREQRLLGLTFLLGAAISLIPTLLAAAALLFGFVVSTQPDLATQTLADLTRWLGQIAALIETLAAVRDQLFSPWFLPALAAAASLGLLGVTALWARRFTPALTLP
jgi:hypothetical protein